MSVKPLVHVTEFCVTDRNGYSTRPSERDYFGKCGLHLPLVHAIRELKHERF